MKALDGKKTYLAAIAYVVFAVIGVVIGEHDLNTAGRLVIEAAMVSGLRKGIG